MALYKSEKEFLAAYDAGEFERPSATADVLIFSVSSAAAENWRRAARKSFSVLLVRRDDHPFIGKWNLPGGFIGIAETSADAARRVLANETGVSDDIYMEQLYTFDAVGRDPRTRVISIAYMALVDKARLHYAARRQAKWFDVRLIDGGLELVGEDGERLVGRDLAFDHVEVIKMGMLRLRGKIEYTDIVFSMMPSEFTLGELQQVYEAVLDRKLLPAAFRRVIAAKVRDTGRMHAGGSGHRPARLFEYARG